MASEALDKQAVEDTITVEECKDFIRKAEKKRADFLNIADRSWNEIEKRNKRGKLYGGDDLDRLRRWTRFPLWWSCLKIRQPLCLARLPIPVLKDTQGDDPLGRTACVIGERFMRSILKTFDALEEFQSSVDDFLVTNFGWGRAFYKKDECYEEEKIRLQMIEQQPQEPMLDEMGQPIPQEPLPPIFVTQDGQEIPQEQVLEDDLGFYYKSGENVLIENEQVYFESGMYCNLYVDPDVRKWNAITRLAFEYPYTKREFIKKFGKEAYAKLDFDVERKKDQDECIKVYEYHDKFLKEVRWFAENSEEFFQPVEIASLSEEVDNSDLYGLSNFFPVAQPMIMNASTKEFWPTPEFFQVQDLIDDIHQIASRMTLLTKAIRVRFLFDSSVAELKQLIGETGEGGGLGVPNLEQALMNAGGKLTNLVAYFPVQEMIQGLENMYRAFEQRLNSFYQVTGISDLIRGQSDTGVEKTYGERQMEGKFALNRIEPYQRKVQEWIKDNYQLLMEMGLKLFSDQTIDDYITPQTLDPEDKQRYLPALELLKSNKRRRFRVDFETDSTISINEQWKKKQAIELANTLTKAMESVANVAQTQPELAGTELQVLKHMIGEFSDGKLFIDEIQDSIQQIIDKVNQPKPEEPNPEMMKLELENRKLDLEAQKFTATQQLEQIKMQAENQLEIARIQQQERFNALENQLMQIKLANEQGVKATELNQKAQQLQADIAIAQEEITSKRNEFLLKLKEIAEKTEVKQMELLLDSRVSEQKQKLEEIYLALEREKTILSEKEKYLTEQRLQQEHQLNSIQAMVEMQRTLKEVKETPPPPINVTLQQPEQKVEKPKKRKRKARILRDEKGIARELEIEELED